MRFFAKTKINSSRYGPPGSGKTTLARAIAAEAKANLIIVNISDLVKGAIGDSEKALSDLFHQASQTAPCIIFIDEMESLFGSKQSVGDYGKKVLCQGIDFDLKMAVSRT